MADTEYFFLTPCARTDDSPDTRSLLGLTPPLGCTVNAGIWTPSEEADEPLQAVMKVTTEHGEHETTQRDKHGEEVTDKSVELHDRLRSRSKRKPAGALRPWSAELTVPDMPMLRTTHRSTSGGRAFSARTPKRSLGSVHSFSSARSACSVTPISQKQLNLTVPQAPFLSTELQSRSRSVGKRSPSAGTPERSERSFRSLCSARSSRSASRELDLQAAHTVFKKRAPHTQSAFVPHQSRASSSHRDNARRQHILNDTSQLEFARQSTESSQSDLTQQSTPSVASQMLVAQVAEKQESARAQLFAFKALCASARGGDGRKDNAKASGTYGANAHTKGRGMTKDILSSVYRVPTACRHRSVDDLTVPEEFSLSVSRASKREHMGGKADTKRIEWHEMLRSPSELVASDTPQSRSMELTVPDEPVLRTAQRSTSRSRLARRSQSEPPEEFRSLAEEVESFRRGRQPIAGSERPTMRFELRIRSGCRGSRTPSVGSPAPSVRSVRSGCSARSTRSASRASDAQSSLTVPEAPFLLTEARSRSRSVGDHTPSVGTPERSVVSVRSEKCVRVGRSASRVTNWQPELTVPEGPRLSTALRNRSRRSAHLQTLSVDAAEIRTRSASLARRPLTVRPVHRVADHGDMLEMHGSTVTQHPRSPLTTASPGVRGSLKEVSCRQRVHSRFSKPDVGSQEGHTQQHVVGESESHGGSGDSMGAAEPEPLEHNARCIDRSPTHLEADQVWEAAGDTRQEVCAIQEVDPVLEATPEARLGSSCSQQEPTSHGMQLNDCILSSGQQSMKGAGSLSSTCLNDYLPMATATDSQTPPLAAAAPSAQAAVIMSQMPDRRAERAREEALARMDEATSCEKQRLYDFKSQAGNASRLFPRRQCTTGGASAAPERHLG